MQWKIRNVHKERREKTTSMIYKNVIPDYDFVPVLVCLERGAKNVIKDKTHAHTHIRTEKRKILKEVKIRSFVDD